MAHLCVDEMFKVDGSHEDERFSDGKLMHQWGPIETNGIPKFEKHSNRRFVSHRGTPNHPVVMDDHDLVLEKPMVTWGTPMT